MSNPSQNEKCYSGLDIILRRQCSLALSSTTERNDQLDAKVDDLHPTEDGEASEEPHGASDETKSCFHGYLYVSFNLVIGGRVKENVDEH